MRAWVRGKHSAYLYSAHILHNAKNIYLVLRAYVQFVVRFLYILPLNKKLHKCKLCANYSQQHAQDVCSDFVRDIKGAGTPEVQAPPLTPSLN